MRLMRSMQRGKKEFVGVNIASSLPPFAPTIGIGISPSHPLIFAACQKVRNLASFETSLNFEPPAFENAARYPNSERKVQCCDDRPMFGPSLVKLGPCPREKAPSFLTHPLKLHVKTR